MQYCPKCKVSVTGAQEVCPLCQGAAGAAHPLPPGPVLPVHGHHTAAHLITDNDTIGVFCEPPLQQVVCLRLIPEGPVEIVNAGFLANNAVAPGIHPQLPAGKGQLSLGHASYDQNHSVTTFSVRITAANITSSQTVRNHPARSPVKPPNTFRAIRL